jgi:hypothetical protein
MIPDTGRAGPALPPATTEKATRPPVEPRARLYGVRMPRAVWPPLSAIAYR